MNRSIGLIALTLCVTHTLALGPARAAAQDAAEEQPADGEGEGEDARTLFMRGQSAYSQGDYDAAIASWTRAYELDPRPLLQFNLSQAYERLGRIEDAIRALELYLERADPSDEHQADARARVSSLRERLSRTSLRIVGGPEGATITVDGEDRGRTPRPDPIQVSPGSHRIVVTAPGQTTFNSTVVVPAGQSVDVPVEMSAAVATGGGGGEPPVVPILLFSVAGATLIAGAVMGGVALADAGNAPGRTSPEADAARGLALGADILLGISAASAAVALIVLLVSGSGGGESEEPARISVAPWAAPTGGGAVLEGRF